jgi:hypothetical protein
MSYQEKYLKYKNKYLNLISQVQKGNGHNNNGTCSICGDEFDEPYRIPLNELNYMHLDAPAYRETTCCKNIFHKDCINRWLANHTTCPNCRRDPVEFVDNYSRRHHVTPLILDSDIRNELIGRLGEEKVVKLEEEEQARLIQENAELEAENAEREAHNARQIAILQALDARERERRIEAQARGREARNIGVPLNARNLFD